MPEWADLQTFFIVLMAILGAVFTIDKLLDVFKRRLNDPKQEETNWKHETEKRLQRGDSHMERQDRAIDLILGSQVQILQHMAYGNHDDDLKSQIRVLQKFLIEEREQ